MPMIAIALGQMIMSFNVASLPVAMGGMVKSFGVPPTTVATGIVAYSMLVAGFVMLGAKLSSATGRCTCSASPWSCSRGAGTDDVQPHRDGDDHRPGALRRGGRGDRAVAGGADRRKLIGQATGDGRRVRWGRRARPPACWRS